MLPKDSCITNFFSLVLSIKKFTNHPICFKLHQSKECYQLIFLVVCLYIYIYKNYKHKEKKWKRYIFGNGLCFFSLGAANAQMVAPQHEQSVKQGEHTRIVAVPVGLIITVLEKIFSNPTVVNMLTSLTTESLEKLIDDFVNVEKAKCRARQRQLHLKMRRKHQEKYNLSGISTKFNS